MRFPKEPVVTFIRYVLGAFEIFLGVRLVLRLLGANPDTPIVDFVYTVSNIIIAPFKGIFSNVFLHGGGVIDLVTLTSMIGYPIIVYLLIELVHIINKDKEQHLKD